MFAAGLDFSDTLEVSLQLSQGAFELLAVVQCDEEGDDPIAKSACRFEQAASLIGPGCGKQEPVLQHDSDQLGPEDGKRFQRRRSGTP